MERLDWMGSNIRPLWLWYLCF